MAMNHLVMISTNYHQILGPFMTMTLVCQVMSIETDTFIASRSIMKPVFAPILRPHHCCHPGPIAC